MGLAERKAIQTAKDTDYKTFESNVNSICGYSPKMEFDWSKLESNPECVSLIERKRHNSYMLDRVVEMLKTICADEMGKTAVREGLKEIKMVPATGDLTFANGVLTIHNDLGGNGAYDATRIRETLEKGL